MDNDFFAFVASLIYNNRDNVEAVLGGGWNKYNGDQHQKTLDEVISVIEDRTQTFLDERG